MHILALRAGAAAVRRGLLARGGSALRTKALSVSITAGKPCSRPLASLLLQPCFMEPQRERPATRSTVDSSTLRGWEELPTSTVDRKGGGSRHGVRLVPLPLHVLVAFNREVRVVGRDDSSPIGWRFQRRW